MGPELAIAAISAASSVAQGFAQANIAKYNQRVMRENQRIDAQQTGAEEARLRRRQEYELGEQAAGLAESTGTLAGAPADVMRSSAYNAEVDALTVRYQGILRRAGMEAKAKEFGLQAKTARLQGITKGVTEMAGPLYSSGIFSSGSNAAASGSSSGSVGLRGLGSRPRSGGGLYQGIY